MAGESAVKEVPITLENIDDMVRRVVIFAETEGMRHIREYVWCGVLESIANGYDQPEKLARIALAAKYV